MKLIKTGTVFLLIAALLLTCMPAAFAASPPAVQTLKPTHMYVYYAGDYYYPDGIYAPWRWRTEDVRATLNGVVNPNGSDCSVYFEYGDTTAYGSVVYVSSSTLSGGSPLNVSANITGLRANTAYHYRMVAVLGSGISYGHDLAFIPSSDSYEIYYNYQTLGWTSRFVTSSDLTGNIEIVATPSDNPTMAEFDITNHNLFN